MYGITLFNVRICNNENVYCRFENGTIHGDTLSKKFKGSTQMTYSMSCIRLDRLIFNKEFKCHAKEIFDIIIKNRKVVENMFSI